MAQPDKKLPAPGEHLRPKAAFANLIDSLLAARWIRFGLVGGVATAVYFICGLVFVNLLGWPLLLGNGGAYALGFVASYLGQKRWTFASRAAAASSLPKFAFVQLAGLGLNSIIVEAAAHLGIPYEISMLIATALVPVVVYFLCRIWVFPQEQPREGEGK